jgi:hypothetical protein
VAGEERLPRISCRLFAGDPDWSQIEPGAFFDTVTGAEPVQATSIKTAWTQTEWRLLFEASDDNPWATLTERDAPLYEEEVVEVFCDPIGDLEGYFEIEVNPLNAVCDLVLRRTRSGFRKNFAWNCEGLGTSVVRVWGGWIAELAIPFSSLGPDLPRAENPWRANFCRIDRPPNKARELTAWSVTNRPNFHVPSRFGWVDFVR